MSLEIQGQTIATTANGYLENQDEWNEEIAHAIAAEETITLTDRHWDVIHYLREQYFDNGSLQPSTRTMVKDLKDVWPDEKIDAKSLYTLFPGEPSKQAARIAGLPETRRKGGY